MKALESIRQNVISAFLRFPVAVLASAAFFFSTFATYDQRPTLVALACSCFWAISATLFIESHRRPQWQGILLGIIGGMGFFAIFSLTPNIDLPLLFLAPACVLSMGVAPYLRKDADPEAMEYFCALLLRNIAFTFWVAFVLFLGSTAILASLHYLFGLKAVADVYPRMWLFCATFFAPVFAMGELPRDFTRTRDAYSKPERIIIVNMLLPLMLLYTVILWLYIVKIALLAELPRGGVAYMVSAFTIGGMALYITAATQAASHYLLMMLWRHYLPLILSAPLVLLVIGIWTRIHDYGVTEERYAIALLATWLAVTVLMLLTSRNPRKTVWLYAGAVLLMFLASFGPWGATSVSQGSQVSRLEALLREHHLLDAQGHITAPVDASIPKHTVAQISSIVRYLSHTGKIPAIRPWFENAANATVHQNLKRYFNTDDILKDMGLSSVQAFDSEGQPAMMPFHHSSNLMESRHALNISGYDTLQRLQFSAYENSLAPSQELGQNLTAIFESKLRHVVITEEGKGEVLAFPLDALIPLLESNSPQADAIANTPITAESPQMRGKIHVTRITGRFDKDNVAHIRNLTILLLYKRR